MRYPESNPQDLLAQKIEAANLNHKSLEFCEGLDAYADGIDGYAATPYADGTQEMTDWFAGWLAARQIDREQA